MKTIKKEDHFKLRETLAVAYREKEKTEVDALWQVKVMGRIRNMGPHYRASYIELFQRLVWQLSPITSVLLLILGITITQIDFISDYEIAKLFMEDPAAYSLLLL